MKIAIGCDHAAYKEKKILSEFLRNELKHEVVDFGTDSSESVDYPSYGHRVGKSVANKEVDKGIVICGSGIGISIAANKIKGVRAALCISIDHAIISRKHNDANVLALGARFISLKTMLEISENWLKTDFEGGRHQIRINKIEDF
tara:strand:- start:102 stop:536 length:435 start_codon:yes stop_codon:yes gene_type:complete